MIIDCHVHFKLDDDKDTKEMIELSKRLGIDKLCVSVIKSLAVSPKEFIQYNDYLLKNMEKYSDTVLGWCFVNPIHVKESVKEFERCVKNYGMIGLKLLSQCKFNDPRVIPLIQKAIEMDVPILQHCGHPCPDFNKPGIMLTDPLDIAEISVKYPKLKILQAHIGGGGDWEWVVKSIKNCPNVYLDTSGSVIDSGMIEMAKEYLGEDRLIFGSDNLFFQGLAKILGAEISDKTRKLIFGKNIKFLLKNKNFDYTD
ncbi:MAG: amidohydrolase family protein [Elusimicrobia bacterium]|nr:amidohydrolase family protein [Elusimicrobiota bacterium]